MKGRKGSKSRGRPEKEETESMMEIGKADTKCCSADVEVWCRCHHSIEMDGHLGPLIIGPVQEAHCGSYRRESHCSALLVGCRTPCRSCSKLQFGDQEQVRHGGKYVTDLKCRDRSNGPGSTGIRFTGSTGECCSCFTSMSRELS